MGMLGFRFTLLLIVTRGSNEEVGWWGDFHISQRPTGRHRRFHWGPNAFRRDFQMSFLSRHVWSIDTPSPTLVFLGVMRVWELSADLMAWVFWCRRRCRVTRVDAIMTSWRDSQHYDKFSQHYEKDFKTRVLPNQTITRRMKLCFENKNGSFPNNSSFSSLRLRF